MQNKTHPLSVYAYKPRNEGNIMAEVDEECGLPLNNGGANGDTAIRHHSSDSNSQRSRSDDNPQRQSSNSSSHHSRQLSIQSNVSDSEYQDYVSELTPLVGVSEEMAPSPTSYNINGVGAELSYPQHQMRHNLQRIPSEESIHTVTALPGMVIRCNSINMVVGSRDGSCAIRPSTTNVVRITYSNYQC